MMTLFMENWFVFGIALVVLGPMVGAFFWVKNNYYRSHDGLEQLNNYKTMGSNCSEGKSVIHMVNNDLKFEVSYFIGEFKMFIYIKEKGQWHRVEAVEEDTWDQFNSLVKIKGPWKQDIHTYLLKEREKMFTETKERLLQTNL